MSDETTIDELQMLKNMYELNKIIAREADPLSKLDDETIMVDVVKMLAEEKPCLKVQMVTQLVKKVCKLSNIFTIQNRSCIKTLSTKILSQVSKQTMIAQMIVDW